MMTLMVIMALVITLVAIILAKESGFDFNGDGDYINQSDNSDGDYIYYILILYQSKCLDLDWAPKATIVVIRLLAARGGAGTYIKLNEIKNNN